MDKKVLLLLMICIISQSMLIKANNNSDIIFNIKNSGVVYIDPSLNYGQDFFRIYKERSDIINRLRIGVINTQFVLKNSKIGIEAISKIESYIKIKEIDMKRYIREKDRESIERSKKEVSKYNQKILSELSKIIRSKITRFAKKHSIHVIFELDNISSYDKDLDISLVIVNFLNGKSVSSSEIKNMRNKNSFKIIDPTYIAKSIGLNNRSQFNKARERIMPIINSYRVKNDIGIIFEDRGIKTYNKSLNISDEIIREYKKKY